MKRMYLYLAFAGCILIETSAQMNELPFKEIPPYPETFSPGNIAARLIDGLGFRFYWATEGLRKEDLDYSPGNDARTALETIRHIYGLSLTILNTSTQKSGDPGAVDQMTFDELRSAILSNLYQSREGLINLEAEDMEKLKVIFASGNTSEFPFWNLINGPIADALWHTGQVVSFRRASGNPFNSNASVFSGKVRE